MDVMVPLKHRPNECRAHKVGGRLDTPVARCLVEAGRRVETAKPSSPFRWSSSSALIPSGRSG
jgi:hypothetical protein